MLERDYDWSGELAMHEIRNPQSSRNAVNVIAMHEWNFQLRFGAWNDDEMDFQKFLEFLKYHKNASVNVRMKCFA